MDDDVRRLVERYRTLAATTPATEFCQQILDDGIRPIHAAVLLRDLYGMNLLECKKAIGMPRDTEHNPDPNTNAARIVGESTAQADGLLADVEAAWREWSAHIQAVDERGMTLLRAAFEAGYDAGRTKLPIDD